MAMTANNWYRVTFAGIADPPWTAGQYSLANAVLDSIASTTAIDVFCISDAGAGAAASIAFLGGTTDVPSDAVTIAATPTMNTQTMDDGDTWYSIRGATTQWYFYSATAGTVRALADSTVLGAFIS